MPTTINTSSELGGVSLAGGLGVLAPTGNSPVGQLIVVVAITLGVVMILGQILTQVLKRRYSG